MVLILIIQATKLARFATEICRETQSLRRSFNGPAEE